MTDMHDEIDEYDRNAEIFARARALLEREPEPAPRPPPEPEPAPAAWWKHSCVSTMSAREYSAYCDAGMPPLARPAGQVGTAPGKAANRMIRTDPEPKPSKPKFVTRSAPAAGDEPDRAELASPPVLSVVEPVEPRHAELASPPSLGVAHPPEPASEVEQARREGPAAYIARRLAELADVARQTGMSREDFAAALVARAGFLCRPDASSRAALARHFTSQARQLDPAAVEAEARRALW